MFDETALSPVGLHNMREEPEQSMKYVTQQCTKSLDKFIGRASLPCMKPSVDLILRPERRL